MCTSILPQENLIMSEIIYDVPNDDHNNIDFSFVPSRQAKKSHDQQPPIYENYSNNITLPINTKLKSPEFPLPIPSCGPSKLALEILKPQKLKDKTIQIGNKTNSPSTLKKKPQYFSNSYLKSHLKKGLNGNEFNY